MKKVTIKAFTGSGDSKVLMGEREENQPETMAELLEEFPEEKIIELVWRSHAIEVQAELRNQNGQSAKAKVKALEMAAKNDPLLAQKLKELKWQGFSNS